jgi:hypothetical protein
MYSQLLSDKDLAAARRVWILRIAAAMCFIGHGAFGIITKKAWVPYFGVAHIPEVWAWKLMPWVGSMDIFLGLTALLWRNPSRWLWAWMTTWAIWTALLRPLSGESGWETLERAGNYGVPLTLFLIASGVKWETVTKVLRVAAAILLCGHAMLARGGKAALVNHWHTMLPHLDALTMTRAAGAVELAMAFFILVEPTATLCLTAFAWKLATESLFFVVGAPVWEFVERGGSYGVPLVLGLWLLSRHVATVQTSGSRMQHA